MITEPFTVVANLTPKDLAEGVAGNCNKCPFARALMRKLAPLGMEWVRVGDFVAHTGTGADIGVEGSTIEAKTRTNDRVRRAIALIDKGKRNRVKPGKYTFNFIPAEWPMP